ncbi:MAG: TRAP transporter permease, partial [Pseudomonadota bacterium]
MSDDSQVPDAPPWRQGPARLAVFALAVVISIGHVWANTVGVVSTLYQNGFHFAGFALLCALTIPAAKAGWANGKAVRTVDITIGAIVAAAAIFLVLRENAIYERGVRLQPEEWIAGFIVIIGAIELTRRATGWIIPVIIIVALSYIAVWGPHIGGVFRFAGLSWETLLFRS